MKKKNGFTLIELLAVIVILAIIALIAVPVIMNVINKANKSAFKDTAYGIISAGKLYFAEQQLELNGMSSDVTFGWPNNIGTLQVKGNVPDGTVLHVNTNGETALAMSNGRYCITKGYADKDVTITEEFTECNISTNAKTLADLATTNSEVTSIASCVTDGTNCAPGTAFAIKVNNTDTYKFRVLNDEAGVVTLIMSSNLYAEGNDNPNVAWLNQEHYEAAGGKNWLNYENFSDYGDANSFGPITALKALKERTSTWTNLEEDSYTLVDQDGIYADYSGEYVQNVRVRLPRRSDIIADAIGCTEYGESCPDWIYEGLYNTGDDNTYSYWLSDASSSPGYAWYVHSGGDVNDMENIDIFDAGVRPVITLSK